MNGSEAIKGFHYQVIATIHYFLDSFFKWEDFIIVAEPPATPGLGTIADIVVEPLGRSRYGKRVIQVKNATDGTTIKSVLVKLIAAKLRNEVSPELMIGTYVSEHKQPIIDRYEKFLHSIKSDHPQFEATGNIGQSPIIVKIDSSISDYSFDGSILSIPDILYLNENQSEISKNVQTKIGGERRNIKSRIKKILNQTVHYKKYKFVSHLGLDDLSYKELMRKPNDFFKNLNIEVLSLEYLIERIHNTLPGELNETELIMRYLFYQFYEAAANQTALTKNEVVKSIENVGKVLNPNPSRRRIITVAKSPTDRPFLKFLPLELREDGIMSVTKLLEEDSNEAT